MNAETVSRSTLRRRRRAALLAERAARHAASRTWLDSRSKAGKARAAAARDAADLARVDRRPAWLQDVDGLGTPTIAPSTSSRAVTRAIIGGRSQRARRITASSNVHARKVPASIGTHIRLRVIEPSGDVTDFGRVSVIDAALILAGAK